jgi:transcriptional regulator with XRE-family HTH domain
MKHAHSKQKTMWMALSTNALTSGLGDPYKTTDYALQTLNVCSTPQEWDDKEYRQAAMEAEIEQGIAWQMRVNREERGWKQLDLARHMKTGQSAISKLEDPAGGDVQLSTLIKAAHAFDCALLVRFVSFTDFAAITRDVRPERLLACGFEAEKTQPKTVSNNDAQKNSFLSSR